ncbi:hypothetical protein C6B37_00890 [Candidatus Phytoplasma phoenicium]|uniref:AAA+ ATPase domain-containing protein n=1 Tax=Candidatus Phytoplasma phoenicium TaxID=198422 RepID=A0A2S8NV55_9MOLU|nr:hypothetical protein C6B37_00890 [Candidatus Phytoplasma phoenicium]
MKRIKNNHLKNFFLLCNLFFIFSLSFIFLIGMAGIKASSEESSVSLSYQEAKKSSKAVQKLKSMFPKLKNNEKLLDKILDKILTEFDNKIYSSLFVDRKDDLYKLSLLEKYNILSEFPYAIAQMKFDPNDIIFAFIGYSADFINYNQYLKFKNNNFQDPKGLSWKTWNGPSNFHLISKSDIEFFIRSYEIILQFEQEQQTKKDPEALNYLKQLQKRIDEYQYNQYQLQSENRQLKKEAVGYRKEIQQKTQEIGQLTTDLQQKTNESEGYKTELNEVKTILKSVNEQLAQTTTLTSQQRKELNETKINANKREKELEDKLRNKDQELTQFKTDLAPKLIELDSLKKRVEEDHDIREREKQQFLFLIGKEKEKVQDLEIKSDKLIQENHSLQSENRQLKKEAVDYEQSFTEFFKSTVDKQDLIVDKLGKNIDMLTQMQNKQPQQLETEDSKIAQKFLKRTDDLPGFDNVIGMEPIIKQLKEVLDYLLHKDSYKDMGLKKIQKGFLLYGPPGTGKSFLANVFAKEAGLPFFALSSDDFSKKYVGEAPKLINAVFEEARKNSPSIILIDDCDAVFKSRVSDAINSDHGNVITSFLSQMEGVKFDKNRPVFVIGTTNYINQIDTAILSRFNRLIKVDTWSKIEINGFLKKKSKEYLLDIRAVNYLDKIIEQIHEYGSDAIKNPRKMIDLLDQSVTIAVGHKHFRILPEDLQLSFERLINNVTPHKWEAHRHQKHELQQLLTTHYYKQIPIEHLYKDSDFKHLEHKHFQLITEKNSLFHKVVYNSDAQDQIKIISFLKDKTRINYNYNSENPLHEDILGFYFEYDKNQILPNNHFELNLPEIKSLEQILDEAHNAKVTKIYFIWNLNKKEVNQNIIAELIKKYTTIYPFLTFDSAFHQQIQKEAANIHNNMQELQQFILRYIENIKTHLLEQVLEQIEITNSNINFETNPELKQNILKQADVLWQKQSNIFSLSDLKNQMINDIKIQFEINQRAEKRSYNKLI